MNKKILKMAQVLLTKVCVVGMLKIIATGTLVDVWGVTVLALACVAGLIVAAKKL